MLFSGLARAGIHSRSHGVLSVWIGRSADAILIACESPDEFFDVVLEEDWHGRFPMRSMIKGIVKRDHSAEFQLVSKSGEMLGDPISVPASVVDVRILSRLVCEVEDRFIISEFDEH